VMLLMEALARQVSPVGGDPGALRFFSSSMA